MMDNYLVKYRFQNSNCQTTLTLHSASESEARRRLIERGTIPEEDTVPKSVSGEG